MTDRPTTLERAFALAKSGQCPTVTAVRDRLKADGYTLSQLEGPVLMRQLRALCIASRPLATDA
jgi:hypothetical protein